MSIEVIELGKDGTYTTMPDPGDVPASAPVAPQGQTDTPADNVDSATTTTPPPNEERLAAVPSDAEGDEEPDLPEDAPVTGSHLNKRISRLTARHRSAEKALADEQQARAQERAELLGRLDTLTRVLSGSAPAMPDAPAPPTGPPSAEQFERHEDFVHAAATYATDQRMQQERQQQQQLRFQQDLMSREQQFKDAHPDFDTVVRGGLAGKVSPVLQQALMLVPDGPAVAYTLAKQPDLVQRLNTLPPPLVLVELGRLSGGEASKGVRNEGGAGGSPNVPPFLPASSLPSPPLPEPMAPVGGGGSMVAPVYSDGMSQAEYERWRARTSNLPYLRRS